MKWSHAMSGIWLTALLFTGCSDACDYTGYNDKPSLTGDTTSDTDNSDTPSGDVAVIVGSGTCADPYTQSNATWVAYMTASGNIDTFTATANGNDCVATPTARFSVLAAESLEELEAEDAGSEASSDANSDTPAKTLGLGKEFVVKVPLNSGDQLTATINAGFDASIYIRKASCDATSSCLAYVDGTASGFENLSYVAAETADFFVIFDSAEGATGAFSYSITVNAVACTTFNAPTDGIPGSACTVDTDCKTGECLCDSNTVVSMLNVSIPGGYCGTTGSLGTECKSTGDGANCTLPQGFCVNAGFVKSAYSIANLCMRPCDSKCDCRTDGQTCVDPEGWVKLGYITQAKVDEYFDGHKVCMPATLVTALEGVLRQSVAAK